MKELSRRVIWLNLDFRKPSLAAGAKDLTRGTVIEYSAIRDAWSIWQDFLYFVYSLVFNKVFLERIEPFSVVSGDPQGKGCQAWARIF